MQGHTGYKGRISRGGGGKVGKKWLFLEFFQTFFWDKIFLSKDIQPKVLKYVKDR